MSFLTDVSISVVNAGLMVYCFLLFFSSFAQKRWSRLWHFLSLFSLVVLFSLDLIFVESRALNILILLSITILISQLYTIKWYNGILLSLLAYALGSLSEFIASLLLSILFSIDTHNAVEGPFFLFGLLLSKMITLLIILFIRMKKQKALYSGSLKKTFIVALIPFSTVIVLLLHYYYFLLVPNTNTLSILPILLCYIFLILSNIIVLDLLEHLYQDAEKENQLTFAKTLIRTQADQYQQMIDHNRDVLKIRHDHKNFLLGLISEIEQKKYDSALSALKEQCDLLGLPYDEAQTGGIVGTVVAAKNELALQHGITLEVSHADLHKIAISEIDLAVILGNALDNAIEASIDLPDNEKNISLLIKTHNNQIIIVVKNMVAEDVDTGNLKTTKANTDRHGFGLLSIKNLTAKYNGEAIFSCTERVFQTYIVLRNQAIE